MAEPHQDEGVAVAGGADPVLGPSGEVDLVLQDHFGAGQPAQFGEEFGVPGGEVSGALQPSGGRVDQPGGADRDGVQPFDAGDARGPQEGGGDRRGGVGGAVAFDRDLGGGEGVPGQVGDDQADAAGADVEGGDVRAGGDEGVEPGVGAAPLFTAFADDGHQAGALEAFEQVGDGRPGQAGEVAQLGRGQGSLFEQEVEGQPVVDRPGGARRGRTRGGHGRSSFHSCRSVSIRVPS